MPETKNHLHYLRHKSGGKCFDLSEACDRSIVDRLSEIRDASRVWESKIINSKICGESIVSGSVIKNSVVAASTVHGGIIENSTVCCEMIQGNVRIENSHVLGESRVVHTAILRNVKFKNLTVTGRARLLDWSAKDPIDFHNGVITRGVWRRPPKVFRISNAITITEGVPGFAFAHCREMALTRWLKVGTRYGKKCGWSDSEILAARKIFHRLLKEQN